MEEKPLYLMTSKEISNLLKDINPIGNSTATGAAACWFACRAYEDSIRQANKDGSYVKAIAAGLITKQEVDKLIKSLPY